MKQRMEMGVISLEACITVPIFMFLILFLYGFIVMFMGQQIINHSLIQSAESLSLDSYATEKLDLDEISDLDSLGDVLNYLYLNWPSRNKYFGSTEKWYSENEKVPDTVKERFLAYLAGGEESEIENNSDNILKIIGIKQGIEGLDFRESKVEDGILKIKLKYKQEFIYNFQGLASFDRELSIEVRMWGI